MQKINFHNGTAPAINDTNLNLMQDYIEEAIEQGGGGGGVSGDTLPVGSIVAYSSTTIPTNWLLCDGRAISRTEYSLLFSIIGTTYGVGDGSTTFNLPNLKGRVPVGVDSSQTEFDTLGETGGEKTHTLTVDEMPSHQHDLTIDSSEGSYHASGVDWMTGSAMRHYAGDMIASTGGDQPHNNLQPYQTTNYIIKASSSAGLVANVANGYSTSQNDAYSCDYVNKHFKQEAIFCKLSADFATNNNEYRDVTNWQLANSVGSAFSISGGKVKIGSGVNKIKVAVKIKTYHNGIEGLYSFIRKNNTSLDGTWIVDDINGYRTIYNQAILDVQENDVITINAYGNNIVLQANATTMIVEKID